MSNAILDRLAEADRLIEEAKAMATQPNTFEIDGHISIAYTPDGGMMIRVLQKPEAISTEEPTPEVEADDGAFHAPEPVSRTRTTEGILNTSAIPEFKGFILKNGHKTRRAGVVMAAYNVDGGNVPGRQIIEWAKADPKHAKEVKVELQDGTRQTLDEFVGARFGNN